VGLGWTFQALPFQCSIRARLRLSPTAHAFFAEVAATPPSSLAMRFGLFWILHLLPFQCSIRDRLPQEPTAHALVAEVAATPYSRLDCGLRRAQRELGLGWTLHVLPFQCSIRVLLT
jgi:hypothetical protein